MKLFIGFLVAFFLITPCYASLTDYHCDQSDDEDGEVFFPYNQHHIENIDPLIDIAAERVLACLQDIGGDADKALISTVWFVSDLRNEGFGWPSALHSLCVSYFLTNPLTDPNQYLRHRILSVFVFLQAYQLLTLL